MENAKSSSTEPRVIYGPQAASPMKCCSAVMSFDVLALLALLLTNPVHRFRLFLGLLPPASDQIAKEK